MVSRPHGDLLVDLTRGSMVPAKEATELPSVPISEETAVTVSNLAHGVFTPLDGFMAKEEFESVLSTMRLTSDIPWTIPIFLPVDERSAAVAPPGQDVALSLGSTPIAVLSVRDRFSYDKANYCEKVFGTKDSSHPGVQKIMNSPSQAIAGRISLLNEVPNPYEKFTLSPRETRVLFATKGWKTIVAFQTRNPPHIGHEYIQKTGLSFVDGVLINPVIGRKKPGDFKDDVILKAYQVLTSAYYPQNSYVLSTLRYEMQYAGPREAIMHAIMRKNLGCTHITIGRDHAGVGNFYKPYAAQEIFSEFPDLGITPLFFREFYYCIKCYGMANERICPHPDQDHVTFSGTRVRQMFESGERPPKEFMRPEVSEAIASFTKPFVE